MQTVSTNRINSLRSGRHSSVIVALLAALAAPMASAKVYTLGDLGKAGGSYADVGAIRNAPVTVMQNGKPLASFKMTKANAGKFLSFMEASGLRIQQHYRISGQMYLVVGKNPFKGIVQPVPEPHEYALMALGLFMMWRKMQTA